MKTCISLTLVWGTLVVGDALVALAADSTSFEAGPPVLDAWKASLRDWVISLVPR